MPIGPSLRGIVGRKAATQPGGSYSRALIDSGIVWNRDTLRRFLDGSSPALPESHASFGRQHPGEMESLLDYLESLSPAVRDPSKP